MKRPRIRISTLMLLVVIVALVIALVVERRKSATVRAETQAEVARAREMAERALYESQLKAREWALMRKAAEADFRAAEAMLKSR